MSENVRKEPEMSDIVERVTKSRHVYERRFTVRFSEKDFIKFDDVIAAMTSQAALQPDDATVERDQEFCRIVWDALKGDHNDLRRQMIILEAFRAAIPSQAALQGEIDRLRIELQNIAETTDDEVTSRQAFIALSKGPKP